MDSKEMALVICKVLDDKKGRDIVLLDFEGISLLTDYFVICNGNSRTQTQALADNVEKEMSKSEILLKRREGYAEGRWILQDYGEVIVHIFQEEERKFYNLERLWGDAPITNYSEE